MSARTFEEFFKAVYVRVGFVSSKDELREAWDASRAALLADRPDVAGLVRDARDMAKRDGIDLLDFLASALESQAAQPAASQEEVKRLWGYAEELAEGLADFIEFFHNYQGQKWEDANAALRAYRAAYPKEPAR